jgi:hypothetical protein
MADVHMLTGYTAMRPVRALVLVPEIKGVEWQAIFTSALRAQALIWGGSANLPVPFTSDTLDHPLFWSLLNALDPDALLVHPGSWADIEDLKPQPYESGMANWREQLAAKGVTGPTAEEFLEREVVGDPFTGVALDSDEEDLLWRRGAFLHHDRHIELGMTGASHPVQFPFIRVLSLADRWLPSTVEDRTCAASLNSQLALAASVGQLAPTQRAAASERGISCRGAAIGSEWELANFLFTVRRDPGPAWPFSLAETGLTWHSRPGAYDRTVAVAVGDDAWDFALSYALRRLGGRAFWLPGEAREDERWLHELVRGVREFGFGRETRARITSVSSPELAAATADAIKAQPRPERFAWETAPWESLVPKRPNRLLCRGSASPPQTLLVAEGRSGLLATPVPEVRSTDDPHGMAWMTDVFLDGWSPVADSDLGPALLEAPGYGTWNVRASHEAIAYQSPQALISSADSLEAQTIRPRIRPLPLLDQVSAVLESQGGRSQLSDKGIYTAQAAAFFGGLRPLAEAIENRAWWDFLVGLGPDGTVGGELPDDRRYVSLSLLGEHLRAVGLEQTAAELTRRGVLRRGLIHQCATCRWKGWYGQDELGRELRCARCRKVIALDEEGWLPPAEPAWNYRFAEVLWQFVEHNSDLALRAVVREFSQSEIEVNASPELDVFLPGREDATEVDICSQVGGDLWVGEAKIADNLGGGRKEEDKLQGLAAVAAALRADGVLLVTASAAFRPATQKRIRQTFRGTWPEVRLVSCARPGCEAA